nr:deoxynucleotidyltransferase terminal-interacting protein 1-like [Syngnathus scovelli]
MNLWVCMGVYSYTDPQVSMDLLRAVLLPSFNDDIMAVFQKYHTFFEKAAHNVKKNIDDEVHADQLIKEACRNVLEHAKVLFPESEAKKPSCEVSVNRPRGCEESSSQRGSPVPKRVPPCPSSSVPSEPCFASCAAPAQRPNHIRVPMLFDSGATIL